jgi:ABC-type Fe3+/spermidine/putrescine transport system ATPase subunit
VSDSIVLSARDLRVERRSRRGAFTLEVASLDLVAGEVLVILGPNGAGKSTLMRSLAGLEQPAAGAVTPATRGPVAMVFQRPAPFAGSVGHNVRAALLGRKITSTELEQRVSLALDRFAIRHLADRRAATLSGGELRRLGLARAFVLRPSVLLLDEPFDDLDTDGQARLSVDLRRAISDTGVSIAMVTHDLQRALLLADRIAVLIGGRLVQVGARDTVLERPVDADVARVVGMSNLIRATVTGEHRGDRTLVEVDAQHRVAVATDLRAGTHVWIGIRPEHLRLDDGSSDFDPIGKGFVSEVVNDGVAANVRIGWAGTELRALLLAGRGLAKTLMAGAAVSLSVDPKQVHLIPIDTD